MPNVKSAEKRARTNEKRRERNRRDRTRMRTAIKKVRQADSAESAREALVRAESLLDLCAARARARASMLTAVVSKPRGFGRILREEGRFAGVVEERDATREQKEIREVNVGVYAFGRADLERFLPRLSDKNSQGELYLTDVPAMLLADGGAVEAVELEDEAERPEEPDEQCREAVRHVARRRHASDRREIVGSQGRIDAVEDGAHGLLHRHRLGTGVDDEADVVAQIAGVLRVGQVPDSRHVAVLHVGDALHVRGDADHLVTSLTERGWSAYR